MFKLSSELRTKIKRDIEIRGPYISGKVKFKKNELNLFYECVTWYKHAETYFKTSYSKFAVKIDIGKCKSMWPFSIKGKEVIVVYNTKKHLLCTALPAIELVNIKKGEYVPRHIIIK